MAKKSLNGALYDDAIVHAVHALRFREDLIRRVKRDFSTHDKDFLDRLTLILVRMSDRDLQRLGAGISLNAGTDRTKALATALKDFQSSSAALARVATAELKELAFDEANFWVKRFNKRIPAALSVSLSEVSRATTNRAWDRFLIAGETINQSVDRWGRQRSEILGNMVRQKAFEGVSGSAMIQGFGGKAGMLARNVDGSPNGLALKLRTAATASASAGQKALMAENDLVDDLVWTSTLDSRTSFVCHSRHGKLVNKELGGQLPPAHPACRSLTTPGLWNANKARELNKQLPTDEFDVGGRLPESETSREWLFRQPTEVQRKVLGANRFKAWESGKMTWPDDFVRARDGKVWTLKELRARDASYFDSRTSATT